MDPFFPVEVSKADALASLERSQGGARYFGAPRDGGRRKHAGIDLGAPDGSWSWSGKKVYAVTDGVVGWVADSGAGGHMITVYPGGNFPQVSEVRYVHLNPMSIMVKQGQPIQVGQYLGTLYGGIWPHLHFQLGPGVPGTDLSKCLDPYPVLKRWLNEPEPIPQPIPEEEEVSFSYAYQTGTRLDEKGNNVGDKDVEVLGLISNEDSGESVFLNVGTRLENLKAGPATVHILLKPDVGDNVKLKVVLSDAKPLERQLSGKVKGHFSAKITCPQGCWLAIKQYEKG